MNLTAEQLNTVHEMASRLMHPQLIAIAIGMDVDEFVLLVKDHSSELSECYYSGFIQAKMDLHEKIIQSAMNGSNPSQLDMKKFIKEAEDYING